MPWDEEQLKGALSTAATRTRPRPDALDRLVTGNRRAVRRRRIMNAASAVALVAAAAVGTTAIWPSGTAQTPGGYASAPGTPGATKARAVFVDRSGVWIYEHGTGGKLVRIAEVEDARSPRWRGDHQVSYASGHAVYSVDTASGAIEREYVTQGTVLSFDASPDGATIVTLEAGDDGVDRVRLYGVDATPITLHEFPARLGRGVSPDDQAAVSWSDDGWYVFVADTFAVDAGGNSLLLIDVAAAEVVAGEPGTQAFWADGTLFYRRTTDGSWHAMDPESRVSRRFGSFTGGRLPSVSPDGRYVAMEVGETTGRSLRIVDLRTGAVHAAGDMVGAPVWLDLEHLAVTHYAECEADCPEGPVTIDGAGILVLDGPLADAEPGHAAGDTYEPAEFSRTEGAAVRYE